MKKLKLLSLSVTVFLVLFSLACNKDNNDEPEPQDKPQEFTVETVTVPDALAQSNDPGAVQAKSFINMANGMTTYSAMMTPPKKGISGFKNSNDEIITWDMNDGAGNVYTITLKITETASYTKWEMIINGTFDGLTLNNFTYLMAMENADGSSSFTVYDIENPGIIFMTMSWYESSGTTYFTLEVPQDIQVNIEVNADGSGMIEVKEWQGGQYILEFRAIWDATGHGQWWEYYDGIVDDQGEW